MAKKNGRSQMTCINCDRAISKPCLHPKLGHKVENVMGYKMLVSTLNGRTDINIMKPRISKRSEKRRLIVISMADYHRYDEKRLAFKWDAAELQDVPVRDLLTGKRLVLRSARCEGDCFCDAVVVG